MRRLLLLVTVAMLAILSTSARAQFCPGAAPWVFDDVPAGDLFCGYITWAAQNGITLGCAVIDANHRLYCPGDPVRRDQMAALLNRLGNVRVEAVGTGPGLTGGPITGIGTINLAATNLLPTTACATNQIPKWNGSAWTCSADANSGGTVTSVGSGTGLSGGPITSTGTLSIATGYQLPQGCTNGQVAKSNGSNVWTCASDAIGTGTVTSITAGNGLTGGTITTSGTIAVDPASTTLTSTFFRQNGNAFGATAVLGTTDNNPLDIRANGGRVMRYEPNAVSPNVIGGHPANSVVATVRGATIGGGGTQADPLLLPAAQNRVTDSYGTVSGGAINVAGSDDGDTLNAWFAVVSGGMRNTASGAFSTVAGGQLNVANGFASTVAGGYSSYAGGDYSFAAGRLVNAPHKGSFAWGDSTGSSYFNTAASDEFAARATGGVRFVTATDGVGNPTRTVKINPNGELEFGNQVRQMLNLYGPAVYGIGVQASTLYARSDSNFAWFMDGVHADNTYDPGPGGLVLATLQPGASATAVFGVFRAQVLTQTSDKDAKSDFAAADPSDILAKVVSMPISTWSYKTERSEGTRHIGPTAQDFKERFGVGYDDKTIATVDADGVALAAIQGLNAKVESQARELAVEHEARAQQAREIAELRRTIEALLARTSQEGYVASR